ncbi:hypothetical protein QTJ16_001820 [Diplocarpon rosae]|uniref:Endonuclease/exonuclease/phosphatase domain-containing protein n=1 Tax=Diplocarpon rosae TaxID=946125 RepID=A0AAD9T4R9_9HELO|nr:hypothetical protein QTJ16_001820 [Diplocarpon rosae]
MRGSLIFSAVALALDVFRVEATLISEINGINYRSKYAGERVTGIKAIVTAKGQEGAWIRDVTTYHDARSSNSIYVAELRFTELVEVGDYIEIFDATVEEFRRDPQHIYQIQLKSPLNLYVVSRGHPVEPIELGIDAPVPTEEFSSLDEGNIFSIVKDFRSIAASNPVLEPSKYGMDFWQSMSGELVTIKMSRAIAKADFFTDIWIVGPWRVTGLNGRGGLTVREKDANPEAILVVDPLDGSKNPEDIKLGDILDEITGVIAAEAGHFVLYPLTAVKRISSALPALSPPTSLYSTGLCNLLTFATYSLKQLSPKSSLMPDVASHIVNYLKAPDLIFLQGIQDSSGERDDGVVHANLTLDTLVNEISKISNSKYGWVEIAPSDNRDGGPIGSNLRQAYLYDTSVLRLHNPNPGNAHDVNEVLDGPELKYNPGRIYPSHFSYQHSYKQLAAAWETLDGANKFFTINVQLLNKAFSSDLNGDPRPPHNYDSGLRTDQAKIMAKFIVDILEVDPEAKIIAAGDFNEYSFVEPLNQTFGASCLFDLDDVVKTPPEERYTKVHDRNCEQHTHIYVSEALTYAPSLQHVHVNTWATLQEEVSPHDPSVARLNVCS